MLLIVNADVYACRFRFIYVLSLFGASAREWRQGEETSTRQGGEKDS